MAHSGNFPGDLFIQYPREVIMKEELLRGAVGNTLIFVLTAAVVLTAFGAGFMDSISVEAVKPYYSGSTDGNCVSVMINVYWGNEYIPSMLDTLDAYNAKATFFIGGMWADKYPELLKTIASRGHEIGNHGYFHRDQDKLSYERNLEEIVTAEKVIYSVTGIRTVLFAPPSGAYASQTLQAAEDAGYKTVMWSKDTVDWRDQDVSLIFRRATGKLKGGDLILMHPTEATMKALPDILKFFSENGFKICTVSQNIEGNA